MTETGTTPCSAFERSPVATVRLRGNTLAMGEAYFRCRRRHRRHASTAFCRNLVPRREHQRHAATTIVGYALAQRLGCAMKRSFLKFNADLCERAPYHTTFASDKRRVKR